MRLLLALAAALTALLVVPFDTALALPSPIAERPAGSNKRSTKKASLLLQGDVTVRSDVLPETVAPSQVARVLHDKEVLSGFASGGSIPEEVPVSFEWESAWRKYCNLWYGDAYLPSPGDTIFSSNTWTKLPGLSLCTTVWTGVKQLPKTGNQNAPGYCFVVIGQKQTATGLPPIVWMFHQIMGTKPTKGGSVPVDSMVPTGPCKSIFSVEERKEDGRLCFRLDSSFQFDIRFPAVLIKLMPMPKAKAEKQASKALSKTISKAGKKAIENGYRAFLGSYQRQTAKDTSPL